MAPDAGNHPGAGVDPPHTDQRSGRRSRCCVWAPAVCLDAFGDIEATKPSEEPRESVRVLRARLALLGGFALVLVLFPVVYMMRASVQELVEAGAMREKSQFLEAIDDFVHHASLERDLLYARHAGVVPERGNLTEERVLRLLTANQLLFALESPNSAIRALVQGSGDELSTDSKVSGPQAASDPVRSLRSALGTLNVRLATPSFVHLALRQQAPSFSSAHFLGSALLQALGIDGDAIERAGSARDMFDLYSEATSSALRLGLRIPLASSFLNPANGLLLAFSDLLRVRHDAENVRGLVVAAARARLLDAIPPSLGSATLDLLRSTPATLAADALTAQALAEEPGASCSEPGNAGLAPWCLPVALAAEFFHNATEGIDQLQNVGRALRTAFADARLSRQLESESAVVVAALITFVCVPGLLLGMVLSCNAAEADQRERIRRLQTEVMQRTHGLFVSFVCHELRNPLHGAVAGLALLREVQPPPPAGQRSAAASEAMEMLVDSIDRIQRLANDVLDYEQLRSHHMKILPRITDMRALCRDVVKQFALQSHVPIVVVFGQNMPSNMVVDGVRVRQVISNGISNAMKSTPYGCICLRLDFSREPLEGALARYGRTRRPPLDESTDDATFRSRDILRTVTRLHRADGAPEPIEPPLAHEEAVRILVEEDRARWARLGPSGQAAIQRLNLSLADLISGQLIVEVVDTGSGLGAVDPERLFQAFVSLHDNPNSYGLGLSICRRLVDSMGGELWLENAPADDPVVTLAGNRFASRTLRSASLPERSWRLSAEVFLPKQSSNHAPRSPPAGGPRSGRSGSPSSRGEDPVASEGDADSREARRLRPTRSNTSDGPFSRVWGSRHSPSAELKAISTGAADESPGLAATDSGRLTGLSEASGSADPVDTIRAGCRFIFLLPVEALPSLERSNPHRPLVPIDAPSRYDESVGGLRGGRTADESASLRTAHLASRPAAPSAAVPREPRPVEPPPTPAVAAKSAELPDTALMTPRSVAVAPVPAPPPAPVPAPAPALTPARARRVPRQAPTPRAPPAGPLLRMIVADDEAVNCRIAERYLQTVCLRMGLQCAVDAVSDGSELVERVRAGAAAGQPYDVLWTDVTMVHLDGDAALQMLRSEGVATPAVAITGDASAELGERLVQEAGFFAVVTKPFDAEKLETCLRHMAVRGFLPHVTRPG